MTFKNKLDLIMIAAFSLPFLYKAIYDDAQYIFIFLFSIMLYTVWIWEDEQWWNDLF